MLVAFRVRVCCLIVNLKKCSSSAKMGGIDAEHGVKYAASCLGTTSKKLTPKLRIYMRK